MAGSGVPVWLGRPSVVPDRQFHALRSLDRHRRSLVRERARLRNRVQKTIDRTGIRIGGIISDVFGVNGRIMLQGLIAGDSREDCLPRLSRRVCDRLGEFDSALSLSPADWERDLLADRMAAEDRLQGRIVAVESAILERLKAYHETFDLLQTIPGINWLTAAALLAEIGPDMRVFGSKRAFTAWANLSSGIHESAGKRRDCATSTRSRHLLAALVEAAHGAIRTQNCQFAGFYHPASEQAVPACDR